MTDNLIILGPHTNMSVTDALQYAVNVNDKHPMREILICGYDDEGEFFTYSSSMTRKDSLWLTEILKDHVLNG